MKTVFQINGWNTRAFFAAALLAFAPTNSNARPYEEIMAEAREAFIAEDYDKAADLLDEAQIDRPFSLYLTRNRILTRILTGRMDEAIAIAAEIAGRGLVLETPANEAFDRMRAEFDFAPVAERMRANALPVGNMETFAEFEPANLLPEAIAKLPSDDFLIGSVRNGEIYHFRRDGERRILGTALGGVFDVEIKSNEIWAVTNNKLAFERASIEPPFAALAIYDKETGMMKREIRVSDSPALFGDLELAANGAAYASDSLTPRIFSYADGEFQPTIEDPRFVNLQGIALDERNNRLFVADYLAGLFVVDLKTAEAARIDNPSNAHLGGIDGLYLYKGDLIGIQNGTSPQRIVRIDLDKKGMTAKSLTVLQQALAEWSEPTHGVVDGDTFYYIATSNWPAYDDEGDLREGASLEPLRIMSVPLN